MTNLVLILLAVFASVALMVVLGERFAKPMDPARLHRITRWIIPLVALSIVISLVRYYMG